MGASTLLSTVSLHGADEVRKDRKKATKHDSVHRLAIIVHSGGQEGVEAAWEATPEFHETWKAKARDMLARAEFRRQKLSVRLKVGSAPDTSSTTLSSVAAS